MAIPALVLGLGKTAGAVITTIGVTFVTHFFSKRMIGRLAIQLLEYVGTKFVASTDNKLDDKKWQEMWPPFKNELEEVLK